MHNILTYYQYMHFTLLETRYYRQTDGPTLPGIELLLHLKICINSLDAGGAKIDVMSIV